MPRLCGLRSISREALVDKEVLGMRGEALVHMTSKREPAHLSARRDDESRARITATWNPKRSRGSEWSPLKPKHCNRGDSPGVDSRQSASSSGNFEILIGF